MQKAKVNNKAEEKEGDKLVRLKLGTYGRTLRYGNGKYEESFNDIQNRLLDEVARCRSGRK